MTTIQREYTPFARISDREHAGKPVFAAYTYQRAELKPLVDTGVKWRDDLDNNFRDMIDDPSDGLAEFAAAGVPEELHNTLPVMTWKQATEVWEHAFYSGGAVEVMARALTEKGEEAMLNYAECQGVIGMPGCPWNGESLEDQKWVGAENLKGAQA